MLLENYNAFMKAVQLGFTKNSETGKWDIDKGIKLYTEHLEEGEIPFEIGFVNGDFDVSGIGLTGLRNLPIQVNGDMDISKNAFSDLLDLPTKYVEGTLTVGSNGGTVYEPNQINSLESNLERVGRINLISDREISSLKGLENIQCHTLYLYNLVNLKSLEYAPKNLDKLKIKVCPIENVDNIPNKLFELWISSCDELTSLVGIPKSVKVLKIVNCQNLPTILKDYAVHVQLHGMKHEYYLDLLSFIINAKREDEMDQVQWPESFKTKMPELIRSIRGIDKYNI